ncbi:MAG: hypothetical protein MJE77_34475 [Proteobacteria bacterium]|nr:hypothetical protein [Pseudomonadota bacterium]
MNGEKSKPHRAADLAADQPDVPASNAKWRSHRAQRPDDPDDDPDDDVLSDRERAFLDELADGIARRHLAAPALLFLESVKPMGFITSQLLYFFRPMVQLVWPDPHRYDQLAALLERRGVIELLLRRLEARY